jgi:hypothetical protein
MKGRRSDLVAAAMALSAAVTPSLFAQIPLVRTPPDQLTPQQLALKPKAIDAPDIKFDVVPNFMKLPSNVYLGEGIGIARNSKNGQYVREIGKELYGHVFCHGVRVDAQDNIWVIDEGSNSIIKFNPEGRVTMVLGRRDEWPMNGMVAPLAAIDPPPPYIFNRPTDVGFDAAGNIFVADGYVNSRIAKYDKNGRFIKQVGSRGSGPGQFTLLHAIAVDAQGNVYGGSRSDRRIVVFDNDLNYKTVYDHVGAPWSLCISPGPQQYLYTSNSNPDSQITALHEVTGQVFKMELDGRVVGKFGVPGKEPGQFGTVHGLDCSVPNEILTSELTQWRMQKFILHPTAAQGGR